MMSPNCEECPLRGQIQVPSEGDPKTCKYVLIGEAPAWDEIKLGRPFVGATGRLLMAFLARAGIKREECYICNALLCKLPQDKKGLQKAIDCCRPRLLAELEQINTAATWAIMGAIARDALYPGEQGGIMASKGWRIFEGHDALVMVHPAFFLYNPNDAPMLVTDLKRLKRGRQPQIGPFVIGTKGKYAAYVLDTHEKVQQLINSMHRRPQDERNFVAFDIETDQIDHQRDRILSISISLEEGTAYIIPDSLLYLDRHEFVTTGKSEDWWEAFLTDKRYRTGSYLQPDPKTVAQLRELFAVSEYRWVGHNSKFDMRFLRSLGVVNVHCDFDTIIAHYTLDERKGGHGLKALADDYFDVGDYEAELFNYISKKSDRYSKVPRGVLYKYNAFDTEMTLRLAYAIEKELKAQGLYERPFMYPMMAALPMLLEAEVTGVFIDWEELDRILEKEIEPELLRVAKELQDISGHPDLNPMSSQKVIKILYDEYKFPKIEVRTRAAGKRIFARSSQIAVIDGWTKMHKVGTLKVPDQAWKFVTQLRHYRHVNKMRGSYIRKWRKYRGTDDRVHTSFLLRGTVTGRLSSKDPPLQTIPSKVTDKWGPLVANMHIPKQGYKFVYADYSQAELMIAACLSDDRFMIKSYLSGADYHDEVSRAAFGENFTKDDRQHCKRLTYGWLFGGNVKEIALDALQFEGNVAERFAHEWDDLFSGVLEWRVAQQKQMREKGYVESILGRRRRYVLLSKGNFGKAMRVAINAPIQAAASDLTLISAIKVYNYCKKRDYAKVVLLIHDSVILEVREDKADELAEVVQTTMVETAAEYFTQLPFRADAKIGARLGDLT